jgi:hypothetical protein
MTRWKRILCKMGFHDWSRRRVFYIGGSNVREWERHCRRCGKREKDYEPI